jgi:hypothetical protein
VPITRSNHDSMVSQISGQTSRAGLPSAAGCFEPGIVLHASLYSVAFSGPQYTQIGKREPRQMLIAERRLWGHDSTGPTGDFDQSKARMRAPISPPP